MNKPKAETVYFQVYLERLITIQAPDPPYDSVNFAIFRGTLCPTQASKRLRPRKASRDPSTPARLSSSKA